MWTELVDVMLFNNLGLGCVEAELESIGPYPRRHDVIAAAQHLSDDRRRIQLDVSDRCGLRLFISASRSTVLLYSARTESVHVDECWQISYG